MNYKLKIFLIITTISLLLGSSLIFKYYENNKVEAKEIVVEEKKEKKEKIKEYIPKKIKVDVKGHVNNPGVIELDEHSRVIDAINVAGGLKDNADTSILNLSMKLKDEMVIIVYSIDELREYKNKLAESKEILTKKQNELVCPDKVNKACINQTEKKQEDNKDTIVNINTATKEELLKISGIGEGKADSIISYREENGNFKEIEDIKNVSGIGDSLFERIKKYITV